MYQKAQRDDGRRALERQARKWEADSEALWQGGREERIEEKNRGTGTRTDGRSGDLRSN